MVGGGKKKRKRKKPGAAGGVRQWGGMQEIPAHQAEEEKGVLSG